MLGRIRAALRRSKTGKVPACTPARFLRIPPPSIQKKPSWLTKWAYKPGGREIDREKIITGLAAFLVFSGLATYGIAHERKKARELRTFPRYTIGITLETHRTKGTKYVDYNYFVNGLRYKGSDRYPSDIDSINVSGGRYFVKFSAIDASNAKMLFDRKVPFSINGVPDSGLTQLPDGK